MDKKGKRKNDITYHNKDVLSKVMRRILRISP